MYKIRWFFRNVWSWIIGWPMVGFLLLIDWIDKLWHKIWVPTYEYFLHPSRRAGCFYWLTSTSIAASIFLIAGVLITIWGYDVVHGGERNLLTFISDFYSNFGTELVSIALTVLVIEFLNERRSTREEKDKLVLQMDSPNNIFSIEAVRLLGLKGWLADGTLRKKSFDDANLENADFTFADVKGASFRSANLRKANLTRANFCETDLSYADLSYAKGGIVVFGGATLYKTNLSNVELSGVYLYQVDMRGVILRGANFSTSPTFEPGMYAAMTGYMGILPSNLRETNLREADLRDADLSQVLFEGAELDGAIYNNETKWPSGFTPPKDATNVDKQTT